MTSLLGLACGYVFGEAFEEPDHRHRRLLRARRERPGKCRAAEKGDELAPPHAGSIARRVGGEEYAPDHGHVAYLHFSDLRS